MKRSVMLLVGVFCGGALAEERYDHRGAVGLLVGGAGHRAEAIRYGTFADAGWRTSLHLGATVGFTERGDELVAFVRGQFLGPLPNASLYVGYRSYFGPDQWKTFADLGVAVYVAPLALVGPRVAFGLQYDFTSLVGAYAGVGAQAGFGQGVRIEGELVLGVQLRSYLLD